jgi:hypothetical protein
MVCFQTKNTNLGKFWRVLRWKMLVYCLAIWSIWWPSDNILRLSGANPTIASYNTSVVKTNSAVNSMARF